MARTTLRLEIPADQARLPRAGRIARLETPDDRAAAPLTFQIQRPTKKRPHRGLRGPPKSGVLEGTG